MTKTVGFASGIVLLRTLKPDFKTVADFRRDNRAAFHAVFRQFVLLCQRLFSPGYSTSRYQIRSNWRLRVVAAYVANNPLPRSELPALIEAKKSGWERG
jgi:hypothetical protein